MALKICGFGVGCLERQRMARTVEVKVFYAELWSFIMFLLNRIVKVVILTVGEADVMPII